MAAALAAFVLARSDTNVLPRRNETPRDGRRGVIRRQTISKIVRVVSPNTQQSLPLLWQTNLLHSSPAGTQREAVWS